MFTLRPTEEQKRALAGPKCIESLRAADFLGKQTYIDAWIYFWLKTNQWLPDELPLCVSESIICSSKLKNKYRRAMCQAVVRNDLEWIRHHNVVPVNTWSVADFDTISKDMFDLLWDITPMDFKWCAFLVQSERLDFWKRFVDHHGPTPCLRDAVQGLWSEGVAYCLYQGADVYSKDYVKLCIRSPEVFRQITQCNPPATKEAYGEFLLQLQLRRVPDVALVEEFFWTHGFKQIHL
jgi:hypothetical protein